MISSFVLSVPFLMGSGSSDMIGEKVSEFGCKRVLLIFEKNLKELGLVTPISDSLERTDIEVIYFDGVLPDSPDTSVLAAAKIAKSEKAEGIVAVGGGSAIDTAKAASMVATNDLSLEELFDFSNMRLPGLPTFFIPTTSGTGSEATTVSVITDTSSNAKRNMSVSPAKLAVLDPQMVTGLPPQITATTGMDAFSHAAEALTSAMANPISDILAYAAMQKIVKYLPIACTDGKNIEARENLMIASSIAGAAFNNAGVHLGHSIAHVLGGQFHIHHGSACAMALPPVLEFVSSDVPDKVKLVGECLGVKFADDALPEQIGNSTSSTLRDFISQVKCPSMQEMNLDRETVVNTAALVTEELMFAFSPKTASVEDVHKLLLEMYK